MKKLSSADPVMGPTENKEPTRIHVKHGDLPGLDSASLGDRVKVIVTGKVISNRAADEYCDGCAEVEVTSMENAEPVKKENAATMHLDKLKSKLPKKEEVEEETETEDNEEEEADEKETETENEKE
jgi:hypothetical protein